MRERAVVRRGPGHVGGFEIRYLEAGDGPPPARFHGAGAFSAGPAWRWCARRGRESVRRRLGEQVA
jgi:hypothetical protein